MNEVGPVLRRGLLHRRRRVVPLRHPHVDNAALVVRMDELVLPPPVPVLGVLLRPLPVHPADQAGDRHPEEQRDKDDGAHHVVLQKLEDGRYTDVLEYVDNAHNVVGVGLLALALVTEALEARRAVGQDVHGPHGVAGAVQVPPAAPLARVLEVVTHAGLLALGLTEGDALALPTLSFLNTVGFIRHVI